jgi:hypothetical protein
MNPPVLPAPASPAGPSAPTPAPKRTSCLLYGCGTLLALLLVIGATVGITLWWIQRPIKPVVLSASEKAAVEEKLRPLSGGDIPAAGRAPARVRSAEADRPSPVAPEEAGPKQEQDRPYVPGSKVIKLTERELNGLLNANTDLGKSVRLEFGRDAINAYVAVPIPQDFPVGGGKMFRARGRFRLSLGNDGAPYAILEDVTVFGLSLPKAWLGGLKGENLISQAVGERNGSPIIQGIKSLRVEPGTLVLEVND